MSQEPQASEIEALDRSGDLLRYAAEHVKALPEEIPREISAAWQARTDGEWSPEASAKFWAAFNGLCNLVRPVTVNTLSANARELRPQWWQIFRDKDEPMTLSSRSAGRFLALL